MFCTIYFHAWNLPPCERAMHGLLKMAMTGERLLSLFANIISIGTFAATILGYMNIDIFQGYTAPNIKSVVMICCVISLTMGYAKSRFIKAMIDKNRRIGHVVIAFCVSFSFSVSYAFHALYGNLPAEKFMEIYIKSMFLSGFIYIAMQYSMYLNQMAYPNGFSWWRKHFGMFTKEGVRVNTIVFSQVFIMVLMFDALVGDY